ncbi:MAG TPA: hypothetical protein VK627_04750 [Edaphobacter sp.]|nr:hypothetical protein [Edaphobacter sp.]
MNLHLTHEQLCDLVLADSSLPLHDNLSEYGERDADVVHEHLRACLICSAELESLRAALAHFREASVSYAGQAFARASANRASIAPPHRFLTHPLYWAAAAAVIVATLAPVTLHHYHPAAPQTAVSTAQSTAARHSTESDEALLEDINQKLSDDVPYPMQSLADPTAGVTAAQSTSDQRNN